MEFNKLFTVKGVAFFVLFLVLALIGSMINFSALMGDENQFFTLYQFLGPIAGAFLGPFIGALSVLSTEIVRFVLLGKALELSSIVRIFPMVFAAIFFALYAKNKSKLDVSVIVPIAAIALFLLNPIGLAAWPIVLYWLIPIAVKFLKTNLFLRSLGATFTAHAVGGSLWVWAVPMPAEVWLALIPVIFIERILFAAGISVSFIAFNTVLSKLETNIPAITEVLSIERNYIFSKKFLRLQ